MAEKTEHSESNDHPGLPPPQFGITSLFLWVAVVGVVLMLRGVIGGYYTLLVVVFLLAVIAHITGNAIGTRLKERSRLAKRSHEDEDDHFARNHQGRISHTHFAPTTLLSHKYSLGKPIIIAPILGFVVAGTFGGYKLGAAHWEHSTLMGIACGVLACGTLGAIGGFLFGSFIQVMIDALMQATRESKGN
jgi:heme O synthase-like polyprenyltransferase